MTVPANPDSSVQSILDTLKGTRITLREAIGGAAVQATSVKSAEAAYMAAKGTSRKEAGVFDPQLFFSYNRLDQDLPEASFFAGASVLSTVQNTATGGMRMNLPTGTSIEASMNTIALESNSTFAFLSPQYNSFGNISLRQPLLNGLFISAHKNAAKADRDETAAKARYDQELIRIGTQVESQYWDLYAAERDYAVQKLTRDGAEAFLKETRTRAASGLIGPNQVANARTFLAEQEILLLDREEQLDRLSDQFASLIGQRPGPGSLRFLPSDNPPVDYNLDDADALVQRAFERNLAIQAAKADVEAQRTLAAAASWEALPKIDLIASLGSNGLSGSPHDVIFNSDTLRTTVSGTMGDALAQGFRRDYPQWSIGVEVTVPIGLRSGLGEKDRIESEVVIAEQRLVALQRLLEEEVRSSCRELFNGKRRLNAAREGVSAAQDQVRIGMIEFQNGRSTAFELVRLGADFAAAQQRYSQAIVRSAKAAAELRQLTSGAYGDGASHE